LPISAGLCECLRQAALSTPVHKLRLKLPHQALSLRHLLALAGYQLSIMKQFRCNC